jgi:glucose/mannose-6-phosphate isomerase
MNLDHPEKFIYCDPANVLKKIESLPDQIATAWREANQLPMPAGPQLRQVVLAGLGDGTIAARVLASLIETTCPLPLTNLTEASLPAWVSSPETLLVCIAPLEQESEAEFFLRAAANKSCQKILLCSSAGMAQTATLPGWLTWPIGQPLLALGSLFAGVLALATRLAIMEDQSVILAEALQLLRQKQNELGGASTLRNNPAKRIAGQLVGRETTIIGAGCMAPVAQHWKNQLNRLAKSWAQYESFPQAWHTTLTGIMEPETHLAHHITLFLTARQNTESELQRLERMRQAFMQAGINTDTLSFNGASQLENQLAGLQFGDYTAYYLALSYDIDPSPVNIEQFF